MKALVGTFNQEKALVGAFSVIVKTYGSFAALVVNTERRREQTVDTQCCVGAFHWHVGVGVEV